MGADNKAHEIGAIWVDSVTKEVYQLIEENGARNFIQMPDEFAKKWIYMHKLARQFDEIKEEVKSDEQNTNNDQQA